MVKVVLSIIFLLFFDVTLANDLVLLFPDSQTSGLELSSVPLCEALIFNFLERISLFVSLKKLLMSS